MLTKKITHKGEFLEDGQIQVCQVIRIMEDGVEISKSYHRHVVDVGVDVTNEPEIVKQIAQAIHTPERIAARKTAIARQRI